MASQIAVSTPAQATRPSRRSRRMSNVAGPRELPAALDLERVLADQPRLDLVPDDREDLVERRILVAGVRLAHDALARVDARDHRGPLRHAVVAAREHAGERHAKGHDLDPLDREGIQARLADHAPRGLLEAHRTAAPRSLDSFPVMCSILSPSAISEKPRSWAANVTGRCCGSGARPDPQRSCGRVHLEVDRGIELRLGVLGACGREPRT